MNRMKALISKVGNAIWHSLGSDERGFYVGWFSASLLWLINDISSPDGAASSGEVGLVILYFASLIAILLAGRWLSVLIFDVQMSVRHARGWNEAVDFMFRTLDEHTFGRKRLP